MPNIAPPHVPNTIILKEADSRFWSQTGFKPGHKLDMSDPTDRAMSKLWWDVYLKVKAEDAAGKLVLTYNHPVVQQHLADAAVATQAAAQHLQAAAATPDPVARAQHAAATTAAVDVAASSAKKAAALQPPVASPAVAHAAATQAHASAQKPPPGVVVFPVGHPAHWHPSAQPAHPDLAQPSPPDVIAPPATAGDHVALAQAAQAPKAVVDAHAAGHDRARPPQSTVASEKLHEMQIDAQAHASASPSPFQLYTRYSDDKSGKLQEFASLAALQQAYEEQLAGVASHGEYVAAFENGEPVADGISGENAAHIPGTPPPPPPAKVSTTAGWGIAAGVAVAIGGLMFLASRGGSSHHA